MRKFALVLALAVLPGVTTGTESAAEMVRFAVVGDTQGLDNADAMNDQGFCRFSGWMRE